MSNKQANMGLRSPLFYDFLTNKIFNDKAYAECKATNWKILWTLQWVAYYVDILLLQTKKNFKCTILSLNRLLFSQYHYAFERKGRCRDILVYFSRDDKTPKKLSFIKSIWKFYQIQQG